MTRATLYCWGRTTPSIAEVLAPASEVEVAAELARSRGVIARGLGRSYGDAAQLGGGVVLDNRGFDAIGPISSDGIVTLGSGGWQPYSLPDDPGMSN